MELLIWLDLLESWSWIYIGSDFVEMDRDEIQRFL